MNESTNLRNAELAVEIVSAFVSKNSVPIATLPALISEVHASLSGSQRALPQRLPPSRCRHLPCR